MSATTTPLEAIKAQWMAEVLLELLRGGTARPNLLLETLDQVPPGSRQSFLRTIQKALERPQI